MLTRAENVMRIGRKMIGTAQAYKNFRPAHNPRDHLNVVMVQLLVIGEKDDHPEKGRLRHVINIFCNIV